MFWLFREIYADGKGPVLRDLCEYLCDLLYIYIYIRYMPFLYIYADGKGPVLRDLCEYLYYYMLFFVLAFL
jgi:hypothetical protein